MQMTSREMSSDIRSLKVHLRKMQFVWIIIIIHYPLSVVKIDESAQWEWLFHRALGPSVVIAFDRCSESDFPWRSPQDKPTNHHLHGQHFLFGTSVRSPRQLLVTTHGKKRSTLFLSRAPRGNFHEDPCLYLPFFFLFGWKRDQTLSKGHATTSFKNQNVTARTEIVGGSGVQVTSI